MKYIVVLGDGMADEPLKELEGKTPLAYGATPVMDSLAQLGEMGMVKNVPKGMAPGSDTANLSANNSSYSKSSKLIGMICSLWTPCAKR